MSEKFATIDQMVEELNKEMSKITDTMDNTDLNRSKNLLALIKKELEEKKLNYNEQKYNQIGESVKTLENLINVREKQNNDIIKQGALLEEIEKNVEAAENSNENNNKIKDEIHKSETKGKCFNCLII